MDVLGTSFGAGVNMRKLGMDSTKKINANEAKTVDFAFSAAAGRIL